MRVFRDARTNFTRILHNAMYKRYSRKLCKKYTSEYRMERCWIIQETLDFSVNAYDAFSCALTDWRRLTVIASFYLYDWETLWTGFSKSFVCLFAQKKNRFHRRVPVVTKLRGLLSMKNVPAVEKKWNDTGNIQQKYHQI